MATYAFIIAAVIGTLASSSHAAYQDAQPQGANQFSPFGSPGRDDLGFNGQGARDPIEALAASIPGGGVPGEDYPILASVPDTGFTCDGQLPGYYADIAEEARCQVFHICQEDGRQDSFLCPNGTVFNQQFFVCDWWYNFDCSTAEQFFGLNADIGKVSSGANGNGASGAPSESYGTPSESYSAPSESYGAPPRNGNRNGNANGNGNRNGNTNGNRNRNGNGGNVSKPSGLYQTPN
ncbi:uncharacterized protein [Palaemon carinicauda]|uniref:uncharacterized protein n=1 Tax=Palaemon carinicauda TaxID=392227 RepID=UPI0035B5D7D5